MSTLSLTPEGSMSLSVTIPQASQLFSYPNTPGSPASLAETITLWISQALARDGILPSGVVPVVKQQSGDTYVLTLDGPTEGQPQLEAYVRRLSGFLQAGVGALADIERVKQVPGLWDPDKDGWRFFLALGLPLVAQRSVQLFHYPPSRLLKLQDYLRDPVPERWAELLRASNPGMPMKDIVRLETIVDSAPVAASDSQGTQISKMLTGSTNYFADYQRALLDLTLTPLNPATPVTAPLILLGSPARQVFSQLYGVSLGVNETAVVQVVPGYRTAVLAANHPYYFYATAQGFETVGSGRILPGKLPDATRVMTDDLISAQWQLIMSQTPTQDPQAALRVARAYWGDPARAATINAIVLRHGSLFYPDKSMLDFQFLVTS